MGQVGGAGSGEFQWVSVHYIKALQYIYLMERVDNSQLMLRGVVVILIGQDVAY